MTIPVANSRNEGQTRRFAVFSNRNFRLDFIGQTISSIGSWTQALAVTWFVLDITVAAANSIGV